MTSPLNLFDRAALDRNRARARTGRFASFLHDAAADEIEERLTEVNRTFTDTAVVGWASESWQRFGPVVPDAETLDLSPNSLDLIVHGLCLHWSNDPVGQLIQCRRALRPDGLMMAVLFGGETLAELRACFAEAEAAHCGGISPRVAPMGEIRALGGLLARAGFALPVADSTRIRVEYATPLHLMRDLRAMAETNPMTDRQKNLSRRAVLMDTAERYARACATDTGRVTASFELIFLTGWAPSANQQQPLRPGTATTRLADALGVDEKNPEAAAND